MQNDSDSIILEVKNLKKSFDGLCVHKDISFSLKKGETLGLLGGSGTGKSVLLRSLIGLEFIDAGEIYFKGKRIDNLTEEELYPIRIKLSYSFQSGALFDSLNVFENIAYPLFEHTKLKISEIREKVASILQVIDMGSKELLMPSDLSGGMQKRVGMARSLIMDPEIILYDEPTAGLDPINTLNILKIIEKQKSLGVSSIFVTHDIPSAIKVCDRIIILDEGKVGFNGSIKEFLESQGPVVRKFLMDKR